MPTFPLASERHGIIAWWENAGGDAVRLVVPIVIPVRRCMEPMGPGAASNIGQPIPILGVQATTTLSKGLLNLSHSIGRGSEDAGADQLKVSLANEHILTEHQNVHFGPQEAVKCFRWFAYDGFILVKRSIENHWNVRQLTKRFYQRVKRSVGFF